MRKSIIAFALVMLASFLFLFGTSVSAGGEELTVEEAADNLAISVENQKVSLLDYADAGMSFLLRVTEKLWKTGKPMVTFMDDGERLGLEFSAFEEENFSLTIGKLFARNENTLIESNENGLPRFEEGWFYGIEWKGIPWASGLGETFEKLRPQLVFYRQRVWFGLSYKFRDEG